MGNLRKIVMALLIACLPVLAAAQTSEDDKGFLTRLLENSLGGEGRDVDITGFRGAFSSEATVEKITIADEKGVWLTMTGLVLDWDRSALLSGRIQVETLSAKTITVARAPEPVDDGLPAPEATPFKLPDLPVSVVIDTLEAERITLGAPLLGEEVHLSLTASASLAGGDAEVDLTSERLDGGEGVFKFAGSFEEASEMLALDLRLDEGENGIAARLLDLPGKPSVTLSLKGDGPLDDFAARLNLSTNGQERLAGKIGLAAAGDDGAGTARRFTATLGGDVTALFAPQFRDFFGEDVALDVAGVRAADGALDLSELSLEAQQLTLDGEVALNAALWPTRIDLALDLSGEDAVLLPLPGPPTRLQSAALDITYAADQSNDWTAKGRVTGFDRAGVQVDDLTLDAGGILEGDADTVGRVTADVRFAAGGIALADPALADAVGREAEGAFKLSYTKGEPLLLSDLDLRNVSAHLTGKARVNDLQSGFKTIFDTQLTTSDLSRFSALAGRPLGGSAQLTLAGDAMLGGQFDITLTGTAEDLALDQPQADALLSGRTELTVKARRDTAGTFIDKAVIENPQLSMTADARLATDDSEVSFALRIAEFGEIDPRLPGPLTAEGQAVQDARGWNVDISAEGPLDARAEITGLATGPNALLRFDARLPDIAPLAPGFSGAVALNGTLEQTPQGWKLDTFASGPYGVKADVSGTLSDSPTFRFDARLPDVSPFAPGFSGAARATGTAAQTGNGWKIDTELSGPYALSATVEATLAEMVRVTFQARLPNVRPLVPAYSGALTADGALEQTEDGWRVTADLGGPYGTTAQVSGSFGSSAPAFDYSARIPDIGPFAGQISGPATVKGTARQEGDAWRIDTALTGPGGTQANVAGTVTGANQVNLTASGSVPLGLTEPFLRPRSLQGLARFDLRLNGAPGLGALSGTVTTSGARFAAPKLQVALTGIDARADIANGRADVSLSAAASSGGRVSLKGPITLTGAMPADLAISLAELVVTDGEIYFTRVSGGITVRGPLTGGARIAGRLSLGKTSITVPSSGITSFGELPPIKHESARPEVRETLRRAGVNASGAQPDQGGGPAYPLDLTISAPSRIFVRGRGLDAELGGELRLTGTTADVISAGRFDLIRGRLDILEKRFVLSEGRVLLQGDFNPYIRFVAETDTGEGTASVIIEGPASQPEVTFSSVPQAPQDEVLSQIFFRRNISELSALQAAQLASAVATLAGKGGEGIVGRLRRQLGVDDLDITTDEEGNTGVRAGKYISDNIYTDVTASSGGGGEVSLNIDLSPSVTVKGSMDSDNESKLGIFFQKDY
ncbi:translocation/assembly module TamB [Roseovarius spongiae]|uniref:Translocation/assembly module TamB n=1 Tax=Roseovarius spongiae TaxID=2320272 RepID=A0A3A8B8V3_9RHOB|nr:translocation/assembly module TamB domain-containing protein [Roseovarius spongiae]RKF14056.1 translocation/assembly module TamB [Roseovarius spongiae]